MGREGTGTIGRRDRLLRAKLEHSTREAPGLADAAEYRGREVIHDQRLDGSVSGEERCHRGAPDGARDATKETTRAAHQTRSQDDRVQRRVSEEERLGLVFGPPVCRARLGACGLRRKDDEASNAGVTRSARERKRARDVHGASDAEIGRRRHGAVDDGVAARKALERHEPRQASEHALGQWDEWLA
jgi:hypothetical protein